MTVIVSQAGTPEPSSEIVARLRRIHPALGLRFGDGISGVGWKLTWEWPASDARWSRVLTEDIPADAAYDVIGYLPMGCTADDAPAYVETHLKNYPREEVSRLRADMHRWNNVEVAGQQTGELVAAVMEDVARDQRAPKGQMISVPSTVKHRRKSA